MIVVDIAGEVVGFLLARCFEGKVHLVDSVVCPRVRGRGMGRQLVLEVLKAVSGDAPMLVSAEVRRSNETARRTLMGLGLRAVCCLRNYYSHPSEDALVFEGVLSLGDRASGSVQEGR